MSSDLALQLIANLLWTSLLISAPLLAITLIVGLIVSIVQVVTQIQEMSLTYIPKIITAVLVLVAFGPWMLRKIMAFAVALISNLPTYFW